MKCPKKYGLFPQHKWLEENKSTILTNFWLNGLVRKVRICTCCHKTQIYLSHHFDIYSGYWKNYPVPMDLFPLSLHKQKKKKEI